MYCGISPDSYDNLQYRLQKNIFQRKNGKQNIDEMMTNFSYFSDFINHRTCFPTFCNHFHIFSLTVSICVASIEKFGCPIRVLNITEKQLNNSYCYFCSIKVYRENFETNDLSNVEPRGSHPIFKI